MSLPVGSMSQRLLGKENASRADCSAHGVQVTVLAVHSSQLLVARVVPQRQKYGSALLALRRADESQAYPRTLHAFYQRLCPLPTRRARLVLQHCQLTGRMFLPKVRILNTLKR